MAGGLHVDLSGFEKATKALEKGTRRNALDYGKAIARQYERDARSEAPWTDRRGVAKAGIRSDVSASGAKVRVGMGASAPNYKRNGPRAAADYMEFLEFDNDRRFAVIFPVVESLKDGVKAALGEAVLRGNFRVRIQRDRKALNRRKKKWREKQREKAKLEKTKEGAKA